ncbi:MAG: T9SS type A sorting domain-containing protein [Bacteroidia bacterium]
MKNINSKFKVLLFFISFQIVSFSMVAQQLLWAKQFSHNVGDSLKYSVGQSIDVDKTGNIYTVGSFSGTVDFDPGVGTFNLNSSGDFDIYISKLSPSGSFIWAKKIGGSGRDGGSAIKVDSIGSIFITGDFENTVDFDPGIGVSNLTSPYKTYICKLDSNGNFIFAKATGGTISNTIGIDRLGNIYTSGEVYSSGDFDPGAGLFYINNGGIFISKLNPLGIFVWAKGVSGSIDCNSLDLDNNGNVFITGTFGNTVDFNPGTSTNNLTANGINESFLLKLSSAGNFVWAKNFGGLSIGYKITLDVNGGVYSTGSFAGTRDFDPGAGTFNLSSGADNNEDAYISKLDSAGNFIWAKRIGGPGPEISYFVKLDSLGNVYTTGTYWSDDTDFDPGVDVYKIKSKNKYYGVFMCKLNNSGNFIWAKKLIDVGQNNGNQNKCNSICFGKNYQIYSTGTFGGTADFDPGTGDYNLTSAVISGSSAFVHAMCNYNITITTAPVICGGQSLNLTVNSVLGATYNWTGPNGFTSNIQNPIVSNVSSLAAGNYTVTVNNGCSTSESMNIIVKPKPLLFLSSNSPVCIGDTLKLNINNLGFTATYNWSGPNNFNYLSYIPVNPNRNASIINSTLAANGLYKVVIKDSNNCVDSSVINATINSKPVININTSSNAVCFGKNITLTATGAKTYNWTGGITNGVPFASSTITSFTVTATDSNGCISNATKQITVNILPIIETVTTDNSKCSGTCNGSINVSETFGNPPFNYLWDSTTNYKTTKDLNSLCEGMYVLKVTDINSCYNYDTSYISITPVTNPNIYLTNLAAIDQVKLSPAFASFYSYNLPTSINANPSNPRNFVDPGKKARFKVECTNQKANGQSIVSGICKVRSNSPFIKITDSSSALNNIGWSKNAWSADEFEIDIDSKIPQGNSVFIDFVVQENGQDYATTCISIPISPLVYSPTITSTIDDDNNPDSKGNDNDICDPNETIEFYPWLDNNSPLNAEYVRGKFENLDNHSFIKIWNDTPGVNTRVFDATWWNFSFAKPQTINLFSKNTTPEYDFVFDYKNNTTTNDFKLYLVLAGGFRLFNGDALSLVQWSLPYTFSNKESVSINDNWNKYNYLNIYPNPSTGIFTIENKENEIKEVKVFDINGKLMDSFQMKESSTQTLNYNHLSNGLYLVKVIDKIGIVSNSKIVINK